MKEEEGRKVGKEGGKRGRKGRGGREGRGEREGRSERSREAKGSEIVRPIVC